MSALKTGKRGKGLFVGTFIFLMIFAMTPMMASAQKPIKIGVAFGLTGTWGDWCKRDLIAVDMAMEEINAAGGVNGMPLKPVIYDTASKPTEATRIVRKLATDDKVIAILGPFSSSECEVAFPVGNRIGIVMIAQASSKPGVAAANRPYAFRNKVDELRLAIPAIKKWKKHYNIKTVVIVHDAKDAVGRALGTMVLPGVCKKLGLKIVNEGKYVTFSTHDFDMRPQITRLKGFEFDGIVFGGVYNDGITFIKEARRQGVNQPMVAGNPLMHLLFPIRGGKAAEGTYTSSEFYYWMAKPEVQKFTKEFVKRAKDKGFDPPQPLQFDVNVYDTIYMLAHVMKERGITNKPDDLARDRELIMKGLTELRGFPGLASTISLNPKTGDADKRIYVVEAKGGEWVLVD
ncbi:MAG: ABC transporter substrate-binding protein [Desulfobacteraceae bacterium]|nr:MAG: ABC transporter substrate-binding protein [Desulfobacteraceae bacterium]